MKNWDMAQFARARCPFYSCSGGRLIECEGQHGARRIVLVFKSPEEQQEYFARCCAPMTQKHCWLAMMKYAEFLERVEEGQDG